MNWGKIDEITEAELLHLVEDEVRESSELEYKAQLPGKTSDEKKEFLFDAAALANTHGGFLLFGVEEEGGVAKRIIGIPSEDLDGETLRMENCLRDGIEPRIICAFSSVKLKTGKYVIILRITESWNKPHMVKQGGTNKFYARNSGGKYLLEVEQIKKLVLDANGRVDVLNTLREERLLAIARSETPLDLVHGGRIILHIIPENPSLQRNVPILFNRPNALVPMGSTGYSGLINFDGYLVYSTQDRENDIIYSYTQAFRNGMIEAVLQDWGEGKNVPLTYVEEAVLQAIYQYWPTFFELNEGDGGLISLTLTGVRGKQLQIPQHLTLRTNNRPQRKDILRIPGVFVRDIEPDFDKVMRPIFDTMWQAWGFSVSRNFNAEGKWSPKN